jgi:hypothetical protein
MKRLFTIFLIAASAMLVGACSTTAEYTAYANSHAQSENARYKVLQDVAATGGESAKVAAVMAMALGQPQSSLKAPEAPGGTALQWLQILLPSAVQAYGITSSTRLGIAQSQNATALGQSTNATMVGIAGLIQAPTSTVTTSTPAPVVITPVVPAPVITPVVVPQTVVAVPSK